MADFPTRLVTLEEDLERYREDYARLERSLEMLQTITTSLLALVQQTPPPPDSASPPLSPYPPSSQCTTTSHLSSSIVPPTPRVALPENFDGNREKGWSFLTSVAIYTGVVPFSSESAQIYWTLSFFKSGRAATFAREVVQRTMGQAEPFPSWAEFVKVFKMEFCVEDEKEKAALELEGRSYHQGERSVDDYVDHFRELVRLAGHSVILQELDIPLSDTSKNLATLLVYKFRAGLNPELEQMVAESEGCPRPWNLVRWFQMAKLFDKHVREDTLFQSLRHPVPHSPVPELARLVSLNAPLLPSTPSAPPTSAPVVLPAVRRPPPPTPVISRSHNRFAALPVEEATDSTISCSL